MTEKELLPLEVSKQLKDFIFELELGNVDKLFVRGSFDIIEKSLNRLEELEKVMGIIKEKKVDIDILISSDVLITYNDFNHCGIDLTETEFNLLKEYFK